MFCSKKTSNNWGPSGTFRGRSISPKMRPPSATTRPGQRPNALGRPSRTGDGGSSVEAFIHGSMEFPIWGFQWINGSVESTKFEATFFSSFFGDPVQHSMNSQRFSQEEERKKREEIERKIREEAEKKRADEIASKKQVPWWKQHETVLLMGYFMGI